MKRIAVILVVLMLMFQLAACTTGEEAGGAAEAVNSADEASGDATGEEVQEKFVVGFAAKGLSDPFTSMEAAVYQQQADENWSDVFEFKLLDCEFDTNKQVEVLENFITMGVDAIICQTDDPEAIQTQVDKCEELGIYFINDLDLNSEWSWCIQSNPIQDGEMLGEYAVSKLEGIEDPVVLFMQGEVGNQHANAREDNCKKMLSAAGIEVTATNTANWQRDEAIALMENWLQIYDHIDAVLCANDDMGLGVVQVLEDAGRLDEVACVASVDALAEAVLSVKQDKLDLTVGKDMFQGCDLAFNLVNDLLNDNDSEWHETYPERVIDVEKDSICLENPDIVEKWVNLHKSVGNWSE